VRRFSEQDLIGKNFLQLNIAMKYQNPYIITDKPAMTSDSLLSNIGGALSLWMGMIGMFFFEVVEVIYVIVSSWFYEKKKTALHQAMALLQRSQKKFPVTA